MLKELLKGEREIAVIGMGYVGLPLALAFSQHMKVTGYDIDKELIQQLKASKDPRGEVTTAEFKNKQINFTTEDRYLEDISVFVVAVPTPITKLKSPDLRPLKEASKLIGQKLKPGAIVIFESTVYPGCTEEDCVPILEKVSELVHKEDFFVAYSPERINPGDKKNTLTNTIKVVAGDTPETLDTVAQLYETIITAGVHRAPTIKVAEASKIVENTQRDLNIALMNELSIIFDLMDINTQDVIEAAGTKWNFLKFYPGLVGGHCIGVDPYYLTYKSEQLGYKPEIILAGRKVNDNLSKHVIKRVLQHISLSGKVASESKILVLGVTFKENVRDIRNSKIIDVIQELMQYNITVDIYDPYVNKTELQDKYALRTCQSLGSGYDGIIAAVKHDVFLEYTTEMLKDMTSDKAILVDIKSMFEPIDGMTYWSL